MGDHKHHKGMTPEKYQRVLEYQGHACATCKKTRASKQKRLAVDHCHKTGVIRGLLCHQCNSALGFIRDNTATAQRMIEYLNNVDGRSIVDRVMPGGDLYNPNAYEKVPQSKTFLMIEAGMRYFATKSDVKFVVYRVAPQRNMKPIFESTEPFLCDDLRSAVGGGKFRIAVMSKNPENGKYRYAENWQLEMDGEPKVVAVPPA